MIFGFHDKRNMVKIHVHVCMHMSMCTQYLKVGKMDTLHLWYVGLPYWEEESFSFGKGQGSCRSPDVRCWKHLQTLATVRNDVSWILSILGVWVDRSIYRFYQTKSMDLIGILRWNHAAYTFTGLWQSLIHPSTNFVTMEVITLGLTPAGDIPASSTEPSRAHPPVRVLSESVQSMMCRRCNGTHQRPRLADALMLALQLHNS